MVYELDRVYLFSYLKNKIWKGLEKTMGKSLDLPKKF